MSMRRMIIILLGVCGTISAQGWIQLSNTTLLGSGSATSPCVPDHWNNGVTGPYGTWPDVAFYSGGTPMGIVNGCSTHLFKYDGGTVDTKRNRLLLWGGGHDGNLDNSVYSVDLSTISQSVATCGGVTCEITSNGTYSPGAATTGTITRLNDPSFPASSQVGGGIYQPWGCPEIANPDTSPVSLQSYQGLVYLPKHDMMFLVGNADHCAQATNTPYTWLANLTKLGVSGAGNPWILANNNPPTDTGTGRFCTLYPPATTDTSGHEKVVCISGNSYLSIYDVDADLASSGSGWTYNALGNSNPGCSVANCGLPNIGGSSIVLDPKRRLIYDVGPYYLGTGTYLYSIKIDAPFTVTPLIDSGTSTDVTAGTCDTWASTFAGPGAQYDPSLDRIVGLYPLTGSTNALVIFDPATLTCVVQPQLGGNGPGAQAYGTNNGIYTQFSYVPGLNEYVWIAGSSVNAYTFALNTTPTYGLGSSTLTCVDRDGDGYGVGPGCTGPDADDEDASVHTMAQACNKWNATTCGSQPTNAQILTVLQHLGYNPANVWYIATTGNDGTGAVNTPASPFALCCASGHANPAPGDAVLWRGGTYTGTLVELATGSAGKPIIYMSYPGELATFTGGASDGFDFTESQTYMVIDGFKISGSGAANACVHAGENTNIVMRHLETGGCADWGIDIQGNSPGISGCPSANGCQPLNDMTVEDSVLYNSGQQHGLYYSCHDTAVCANIFTRRSIAYGNPWNGFHHTGQFSNAVYEQLFTYNNGLSGYSWQNGTSNSYLLDSVDLNSEQGMDITFYNGTGSPCGTMASDVCVNAQNNNVLQNLTFYQTGSLPTGGGNGGTAAVIMGRQASACSTTACTTQTMTGNVFRNIVAVTNNTNGNATTLTYPPFQFPDSTGVTFLPHTTFQNINGFDLANSGIVVGYGGGSSGFGYAPYNCSTLASVAASVSGCQNANPQFVASNTSWWSSLANFNLRLQSSSPSAGAGVAGSGYTFDLAGTILPGSAPSEGAYQTAACNITPTSIGPYTVGQAVSQTFTANNCSSGTWASSGSFPPGLSLNTSTGVLSGTVTGSSGSPYSATVTYSTASDPLTVTVNAQPVISTACPLPSGTQGSAYSDTLTASSAGTAPDTWSISGGTGLPPGLSLSGAAISGTPTASGTFTFNVALQDSNGVAATNSPLSCSLTINPSVVPRAVRAGEAAGSGRAVR